MKHLIVGSGITGTLLAWKFYQNNIPFEIWSDFQSPSASQIAAGLINPITGQRLAKILNYENILHDALLIYQDIEKFFNIPLIFQHKIYRFIENENLKFHFHQKINNPNFQSYLNFIENISFPNLFTSGEYLLIQPVYRIHLSLLLTFIHEHFKKLGLFFYKNFDDSNVYKNFTKIFLCRGYKESDSNLFPDLKWENALGEIIIFFSKDLQLYDIYQNQKMTIIPLGNDYYWLGATYLRDMKIHNYQPSEELENFLFQNLKVSYTIVNKQIGIRPILKERKPIFLQSSIEPQIFLINGMGSKGTLWVPHFIENEVLKNL